MTNFYLIHANSEILSLCNQRLEEVRGCCWCDMPHLRLEIASSRIGEVEAERPVQK